MDTIDDTDRAVIARLKSTNKMLSDRINELAVTRAMTEHECKVLKAKVKKVKRQRDRLAYKLVKVQNADS